MPLLVYIVLINVLVRIVASAVRKTREPKNLSLCAQVARLLTSSMLRAAKLRPSARTEALCAP